MQRSSKTAALILILLVGAVTWHLLSKNPPTDDALIRSAFDSAVYAANEKSASGIMAEVADDFQDDNGTNPVRLRAELMDGFHNTGSLTVFASPALITVTGDDAVSTSHVSVHSVTDGITVFNGNVTLTWHRYQTHRWLVIPARVWLVNHASFPDSSESPYSMGI
jgi:hypothetical protein